MNKLKKLFKSNIVEEHIIPVLIILSWFGVVLLVTLRFM